LKRDLCRFRQRKAAWSSISRCFQSAFIGGWDFFAASDARGSVVVSSEPRPLGSCEKSKPAGETACATKCKSYTFTGGAGIQPAGPLAGAFFTASQEALEWLFPDSHLVFAK